MDINAIKEYTIAHFKGTNVATANEDILFLYNVDDKFPFATIVTLPV